MLRERSLHSGQITTECQGVRDVGMKDIIKEMHIFITASHLSLDLAAVVAHYSQRHPLI